MLTLFLRNSIFTVSSVYSGSQSELLLPAEGPSAAGWLGTCSLGTWKQVPSHWQSHHLLLFPDRAFLDSTVNTPIHLIAGCQHEMALPSQKPFSV